MLILLTTLGNSSTLARSAKAGEEAETAIATKKSAREPSPVNQRPSNMPHTMLPPYERFIDQDRPWSTC